MQRGSSQMWDRRLLGIKAVIQRQQGVLAEGDDNRFLFNAQHRGTRVLRARAVLRGIRPAPPLGDCLGVDPVTLGQRSQALLTMLYRSTDCRCRAGASV